MRIFTAPDETITITSEGKVILPAGMSAEQGIVKMAGIWLEQSRKVEEAHAREIEEAYQGLVKAEKTLGDCANLLKFLKPPQTVPAAPWPKPTVVAFP